MIPEGLILKTSPIDGLGIFSIRDFPAKHCFGEFTGVEMSLKDFRLKYGKDNRYCYRMRRQNKIIVAKEERNFITYINDGKHNQTVQNVNVILAKRHLYAIRDIKEGEELLLDYGFYYLWHS
jgi:SET domain-containing protein